MDVSKFAPDAPGEMVEIEGREKAFVPDPLPPARWILGGSTWGLLVDAMHELGRLDGVAITLPDPGILLRPLENREALRSSSLEGTHATPRELLLFELPDGPETRTNPKVGDWREVWNYRTALSRSSDASVVEAPLYLIRQLHTVLLTGGRGAALTPGAFRTRQVFIGADHRFTPAPPTHVVPCLELLEQFIRNASPEIPPLVRAFLAHYQFEAIHPFLDGNGRVGRLLMTLMIRELCQHKRPWLYLSAFFDRHRDEYIDRLFMVSAAGDWKGWVEFCLRATIAQARDTFERCTNLIALREDYRGKVGNKPRLSMIVDMLFTNQFIRTAALGTAMNVTYPTAQRDVDQLVKLGILEELKDMYPRTHVARAIYDVAFTEPDEGAPSAVL